MTAKALVEFRDVIRVWIEFRAPKKGELTWAVPADATPAEALDHVVTGRDVWASGEAGFGYRSGCDQPEFEDFGSEEDRSRNIVVHVEHIDTEPKLVNVMPHVRLL